MDKKRILIVDDEQDIVEMVKLRLLASGYDVITACDGIEGLNIAKRDNPDLILLDLMLPKMDGYQVCRLLKFDEGFSHIPVIMLTAKTQREDKEWGKTAGADLYITKPFQLADLVARINEILSK